MSRSMSHDNRAKAGRELIPRRRINAVRHATDWQEPAPDRLPRQGAVDLPSANHRRPVRSANSALGGSDSASVTVGSHPLNRR